MSEPKKPTIAVCVLLLYFSLQSIAPITFAQDETEDAKIIDRYKVMLSRKPREGSTFDRLYQMYLEGPGLNAMVTDYQTEAKAKPNDANIQLILGHLYKRLGKDKEALATYQHAVKLNPSNYYTHFALGKLYVTLRQHEDAIQSLEKSATLSEQSQSVSPEELTDIYKVLGNAHFSRDQLDDAIQVWEKISKLDPHNVFARIELADLFQEKELYTQAIAQHQAIIDIKNDDPYRKCLSMREIGKIYEDTGAYEDAMKYYDRALDLTAQGNWLRKDLQFRIIAIYSADANWKDLIAYYQNKLNANPNDPELLSLLADAYIENQQLDEGISRYKKGLELAPTDPRLRLQLISTLRNAEKYDQAASEYELLSEQKPDDFGIYRELGKLYLQLDNQEKAKTVYQKMIDRDPENASTYITLAEIYTGHEWVEEAAEAYQMAITLAPENLDYIEYFGEFYFRQGNREKAIETWNHMVTNQKNTPENYDRLARLLESKKYTKQAIDASRKAVELMPDAYRFREALAKRLMNNKQYNDALIEYTEAIKLAPNDYFTEQMDDQRIEIYRRQGTLVQKIEDAEQQLKQTNIDDTDKFKQLRRLAKMYIRLANTTYALEILLQAKELQPNNISVNRQTAELFTKQGRRDEAIEIYTHLAEIDNSNAREYYAHIANAYLKGMDLEAATVAAKQVIAHSPRNPEGHELLAQIAKQSANFEDAIDSYKQAIRLRPEGIDIRTELASIFQQSGKLREAIAQYWRCWEVSDNVSDKLSFIKPISELYYDLGRSNELQEKLKQMSKSNTTGIAPVLALAQVYRIEGDLPNARFQLARALDRQSDSTELLSQLVEISLDLGEIDEALSYQQRLVKVNPDPFHRQTLGELLFDVGREQEAVQAWSKVLHAKNQTFDAEIKLAKLLINHGLLEEALFALDSAAEKITGKDTHLDLYQIGVTLIEINEQERAIPHFQRIIAMSEPVVDSTLSTTQKMATTSVKTANYKTPNTNVDKITLARNILNNLQRQSYGYVSRNTWRPKTFDETQAGALVQLKIIMEGEGKLDQLINQFEKNVTDNPNDIQSLEQLAQLYTVTRDGHKTQEITDKLIAAAPDNPAYQRMQLNKLQRLTDLDYNSLMEKLNEFTWLKPATRQWYMIDFAKSFYNQGKKDEANKLVDDLQQQKIDEPTYIAIYFDTLTLMDRMEAAENIIAEFLSTLTPQLSQKYSNMFKTLASTYQRNNNVDKAAEFYWLYFDSTKPKIINPRRTLALGRSSSSYGGYSAIQTYFPAPTIYYDQSRLQYLQQVFNQLWLNNQHQALYTILQKELEAAENTDRIYPALALCYCHWWENKREKALEILAELQKEFSDDLTLKLNTALVAIQAGEHKEALTHLNTLATLDPRNRRQYYDLTLQIAVHIGDIVTVRELMSKVLNSPSSAQELYRFSQKLQQSGLTQFAIAVAKKTMTLAMRERDPNFLVQLSQHLSGLGRAQDAARIASRALQFANQKDRYGQTLYPYQFQQAARLANRSSSAGNTATKLINAVEKNPNSFQAHLRLASHYQGRNQINKASESYDAALKLRPNDYNTRMRYVQMLQRNRQLNSAVEQYSILLKDKKSTAIYNNYWDVVRTYFEAGKANDLLVLVKELLDPKQQYPRGTDFAQNAAQEFLRRNNPKAAIEIYEIMMNGSRDYVYHQLSSAYAAAGQREKAINLLRENLKTQPNQAKVSIILSLIKYEETKEEIKALAAKHDQALTKENVEPSLLYLASITKIVIDEIEKSDPIIQRLIKTVPPQFRLQWFNTIAITYRQKKDFDREIRILEAATENIGTRNHWQLTDIYRRLATAYKQKGELEKSKNYIRRMGTLKLMGSGSSYWEKEEVARTYTQYQLWDDAENLLNEIMNDLSAPQHYRERAREQFMVIKQKQDGGEDKSKSTPQTEGINITLHRSMAQEHMRRNQIPEAIELYEQIAKVMPEDLESRSRLASLYSRQNQHDKALETWKALIETDPENTKFQDGIVNAYVSAGKVNEAIELAKNYLQNDADTGVHYSRLARVYDVNNQIEETIATYKKAIELSPGDANVLVQLAEVYMHENDLQNAEKTFKEALQYAAQSGQHQNIERQLMDIYKRQGKLNEYLKEAEEKGNLSYEMQKELARSYYNNGKLDEAAKAYEKALQIAPHEWEKEDVERQLLAIYRRQGKLEEKLKEADKKGSLTVNMQIELARQYRNKREFDKVISTYKKALSMSSSDREREKIYTLLMREYVEQDKDDAAVDLFNTMNQNTSSGTSTSYSSSSGFVISHHEDEARQTLINAYKSKGKLNHLREIYEVKLKNDKNNPTYLEITAEIYLSLENHEKTAQAYKTLSKANPSNVRSYYRAAAAFNKSGEKELAEDMVNQGTTALASSGRNHESGFLSALGSICDKGKLHTHALKLYKNALVNVSSRSGSRWEEERLYEVIGQCALAAKDYEEAVEAYKELKKITRNDSQKEKADRLIKKAFQDGKLYEKQIPLQIKKVQENPDDVDGRVALAQNYILAEKYDDAITQYQKISELQPDKPQWQKKIGELYSNSTQSNRQQRLDKAATAYQKAIEIDPKEFEFYSLLAQTHKKQGEISKAEEVYRQSLQADLKQTEHDTAVKNILALYKGQEYAEKRLTLLKELGPKTTNSPFIQKSLGDAYVESGDTEKAAIAYRKWLEIQKNQPKTEDHIHRRNLRNLAQESHQLAERLLELNVLPEIALELAKQSAETRKTSDYFSTLGQAYLVNEQYGKALRQFQSSFNLMMESEGFRGATIEQLLTRISEAGEKVEDKSSYIEMMSKLVNSIPINIVKDLKVSLSIAKVFQDLDMAENATKIIQKTGFFPDKAWLTLGPFNNAKGVGYNTAFITEETAEIDLNAKYKGVDAEIKWEQANDDTIDGFFAFGTEENPFAAYAWITFNSPEERKAQIKFDSDDQGKVWLNAKKVYAHRRTRGAQIDRRTIPVTLTAGQNSILVKVCNESLPWGFYLRITDPEGKPFDDLRIAFPPQN